MSKKRKLVRIGEAAEILGIPKSAVYTLAKDFEIPHYRITPRRLSFDPEELEAWLESRKYGAMDDDTEGELEDADDDGIGLDEDEADDE